jgi:hypothetical protein
MLEDWPFWDLVAPARCSRQQQPGIDVVLIAIWPVLATTVPAAGPLFAWGQFQRSRLC